jgi:hypothetical protein
MLRSAFLWDITQRRMVILYQRFGTTYRSHLQGSRSPRRRNLDFFTLGNGTDTSVKIAIRRCEVSQKNTDLISIAAEASKSTRYLPYRELTATCFGF